MDTDEGRDWGLRIADSILGIEGGGLMVHRKHGKNRGTQMFLDFLYFFVRI